MSSWFTARSCSARRTRRLPGIRSMSRRWREERDGPRGRLLARAPRTGGAVPARHV